MTTRRRVIDLVAYLTVWAAIAILVATMAGCNAGRFNPRDEISTARIGVSGLSQRFDLIGRLGLQIQPHATEVGQALARSIYDMSSDGKVEADAVLGNLDKADRDAARATEQYAKLEAKWYVRLGRWLTKWFWIVAISWLVLGVASAFAGLNPLSWTGKLGRFFILAAPLANPFTWLKRVLANRRKTGDSKPVRRKG